MKIQYVGSQQFQRTRRPLVINPQFNKLRFDMIVQIRTLNRGVFINSAAMKIDLLELKKAPRAVLYFSDVADVLLSHAEDEELPQVATWLKNLEKDIQSQSDEVIDTMPRKLIERYVYGEKLPCKPHEILILIGEDEVSTLMAPLIEAGEAQLFGIDLKLFHKFANLLVKRLRHTNRHSLQSIAQDIVEVRRADRSIDWRTTASLCATWLESLVSDEFQVQWLPQVPCSNAFDLFLSITQ
jgi:hypothetical protein